MPIKDWTKMTKDELLYTFEWAQKIGFHFLAKEVYNQLKVKGLIKEDKSEK